MEQILSVISIILAVIGLAVVVISFKLEKDRKEKIKKYQNAIKRRDARIKDLEEENTFLKHQSGYHTNWLKGLAESERTETPEEKLKGALEEMAKCDVLSNFDSLQDIIKERKRIEKEESLKESSGEKELTEQSSPEVSDTYQSDDKTVVLNNTETDNSESESICNDVPEAVEIESPEEIVIIPVESTIDTEVKKEENDATEVNATSEVPEENISDFVNSFFSEPEENENTNGIFTPPVAETEVKEFDEKDVEDVVLQEEINEFETQSETNEEVLTDTVLSEEILETSVKEEGEKVVSENSSELVVETPTTSESTNEVQSDSSEKSRDKIEEIKDSIETKVEAIEDKAEEFFDNIEDMFETLFGDEDEEDED